MAHRPANPSVLGDPEALENHKRRVFEKMEIRLPRGGTIPYKPHPHQEKVHFPGSLVTHQSLACGRRGGKSKVDEAEALAMMDIEGTVTWVGAPTYTLTDRVFQPVYKALVIEKIFGASPVRERNSQSQRYIEMPWGSIIEGKSAERPESSKGASLDLFIDDECAEHSEEYFTEYVGPGLADRQGRALFTSTPLGLTWFHDYYKRGKEPKFQRMGWRSYTWRSEDNPHLDKEWLHQQKLVVPRHVWEQEYLAKFLARSGLIWEDYRDKMWDDPDGGHLFDPEVHHIDPSWVHVRGIDVGTAHPAACVWAAIDPQNNIWIYDEYWEKRPLHHEHAVAIAAKTLYPVTSTFISWEANTGDGKGGETVLQIYRNAGIYANLAPKDPEPRVDAVSMYLRAALQDASRHPKMLVSVGCPKLRAQILKYRHKTVKPGADVGRLKIHSKGRGDDLCDALGHAVVTKPQYMPQWLEEAAEDNFVNRYGYQESAFARTRQPDNVVGIQGLATLPWPGDS